MFTRQLLRNVARTAPSATTSRATVLTPRPIVQLRCFNQTVARRDNPEDINHDHATTSGQPGESGDHEGQFARTNESVRVEYPDEDALPRSAPVRGRGGVHDLRTLASFSLDGRVGVVTGGARGLGLVMAQALVTSGAHVALVDMNSLFAPICALEILR